MKTHEQYMISILKNPEWMRSAIARHGRNGSIGAPELAAAVINLHDALSTQLDVDEDASEVMSGGASSDDGS